MLSLNIHSGLQDGASIPLGSGLFEFGYESDAAYELLDGDQPFKIGLQVKSAELGQVQVQVFLGDIRFCDALGNSLNSDLLTAPFFIGVGQTFISVSLFPYAELPAEVLRFFTAPEEETQVSLNLANNTLADNIASSEVLPEFSQDLGKSKRKAAWLFLASAFSLISLAFYVLLLPQEDPSQKVSFEVPQQLKVVQPSGVLPVVTTSTNAFSEVGEDSGTVSVEDQRGHARRWLFQTLDDNSLSEQLKVDAQTNTFFLQGRLSKSQLESFERILFDFGKQFGEQLQIKASIEKPKDTIPFTIREVSPGVHGWIVASTGEKIFLGGEYLGYRLVEINKNRVSFRGLYPIEVDL